MFKVIEFDNKSKWNSIVKSFEDYDIYYNHEYVAPFAYFENSKPLLLYYKGKNTELCYVVEIRDISKFEKFKNSLECQKYFDISTPYGYGGPLVKNFNQDDIADFFGELYSWANDNNIVSQFLRFHPLIENHKYFENFCSLRTFKKTVYIDLSSPEIIYKNMNDKCRNMIKKAQKNNLKIVIDNSKEAQSVFKKLYKETMQKNYASEFYYFDDNFFENIFESLGEHCNLFSAKYNDEIIVSCALIYESSKYLHYHLSCSNSQYSKLGANNLLLYEVSKYGCKKGYEAFHLGGGVEAEDGLFIFKKSFNKSGLKDFYIGRNIFSKEKYNFLMNKRKELDFDFDLDTNYLIGYRS